VEKWMAGMSMYLWLEAEYSVSKAAKVNTHATLTTITVAAPLLFLVITDQDLLLELVSFSDKTALAERIQLVFQQLSWVHQLT
jgi:hypothetical protein